jgi:aminoglycoside/choline kinase family phosphotransferase
MQKSRKPFGKAGITGRDSRLDEGRDWAARLLGWPRHSFSVIAADASFRRYFRLQHGNVSRVLMDAPPLQEDSRPFVKVNRRLREAGLHAPEIFHADVDSGFLILEDLGDTLYRELIDENSADELFPPIFDVLETMATRVPSAGLPDYDTAMLQQEMDLFPDWYLKVHRETRLSAPEHDLWQALCRVLTDNAAEQPQVFVHRDFHSCNLLRLDGGQPAIIDFQDAVRGPLVYDLASFLWDRYHSWPRVRINAWLEDLRQRLEVGVPARQWRRWCDLTGLQRNLKIVGIFARLRYRDNRQGYIEMIPRFYRYVLDVLSTYPEFADIQTILEHPRCAP